MTENNKEHERRFNGAPDRLRSEERMALLEVQRVVALSTEGQLIQSVLDVGTGSGVFAEAFSILGMDVTGIDTNSELLEIARQHVPMGNFRQAPVEAIPFPDQSFDLVFLGHVLHEADNTLEALKEVHRVARRQAAILEWPYRDEQKGPPLAHRLSTEAVTSLASKAGFQKVETIALQHMDFYRLTP